MNTGGIFGIILLVILPILVPFSIGLIAMTMKFFLLKCRSQPWQEIYVANKIKNRYQRQIFTISKTEQTHSDLEAFYETDNQENGITVATSQIIIPIDFGTAESDQQQTNKINIAELTHQRLERLKQNHRRSAPFIDLSGMENEVQRHIEQSTIELNQPYD